MKKILSMVLVITALMLGIVFFSSSDHVYAEKFDDTSVEFYIDTPKKGDVKK